MGRLIVLQFFGVITETFDPWERPEGFVHPLRPGVKEMLNRLMCRVATPEIVAPNNPGITRTLRQGTDVWGLGGCGGGPWKDLALGAARHCIRGFVPLERRDAEIQFRRSPPGCCRASLDNWDRELQSMIALEAYQRWGWANLYPKEYVTMIGCSASRLESTHRHGSCSGLFVAEGTTSDDIMEVSSWDRARARVLRTTDEVANFILECVQSSSRSS